MVLTKAARRLVDDKTEENEQQLKEQAGLASLIGKSKVNRDGAIGKLSLFECLSIYNTKTAFRHLQENKEDPAAFINTK